MDFVDIVRAGATSVGGGLGSAVSVDLLLIAPVRLWLTPHHCLLDLVATELVSGWLCRQMLLLTFRDHTSY